LHVASGTGSYSSGKIFFGGLNTGDPYYYGTIGWDQSDVTMRIGAQCGNATGGIAFYTSASTAAQTEKMRITSGGNVGIGTTSPVAKLNIFGTSGNPSTTADTYNLFSVTGNLGPQLNIGGYNGSSYGMWLQVKDAGNGGTLYPILLQPLGGNVGIGTTSPSVPLEVYSTTADVLNNPGNSQIRASASSSKWLSIGYDGANNVAYLQGAENAVSWRPIVLNLNGAESSPVLIGQASSDGVNKLQVNGGIYASSSIAAVVASNIDMFVFSNTGATYTKAAMVASIAATGGTGSYFFYGQQSTSTVALKIFSNGNIQNTNNSYGAISDARLKENIKDATPKLDDLMKVKVRNYNLKGESNKQLGVISQELEAIFPNMIEESTNMGENMKIKGVKYSVFVPMLIKAVQELKAEIEILKNK
jgi:hypothetical protein